MKEYLSIGEVSKELGVCVKTLHRWENLGKLKSCFRTIGNHRRYFKYDVLKFKNKHNRINVGYARVSSYDQKKDLKTQVQFLNHYSKEHKIVVCWSEIESLTLAKNKIKMRKKMTP